MRFGPGILAAILRHFALDKTHCMCSLGSVEVVLNVPSADLFCSLNLSDDKRPVHEAHANRRNFSVTHRGRIKVLIGGNNALDCVLYAAFSDILIERQRAADRMSFEYFEHQYSGVFNHRVI